MKKFTPQELRKLLDYYCYYKEDGWMYEDFYEILSVMSKNFVTEFITWMEGKDEQVLMKILTTPEEDWSANF